MNDLQENQATEFAQFIIDEFIEGYDFFFDDKGKPYSAFEAVRMFRYKKARDKESNPCETLISKEQNEAIEQPIFDGEDINSMHLDEAGLTAAMSDSEIDSSMGIGKLRFRPPKPTLSKEALDILKEEEECELKRKREGMPVVEAMELEYEALEERIGEMESKLRSNALLLKEIDRYIKENHIGEQK